MVNHKDNQYQKDIDILAVGGIDVDWLLKMSKLPSFDEKLTAEFIGKYPGGPVGNFACIASHLGLRVASMCTVGDDPEGSMLINDFQNFNVDVSYIAIKESATTPFVIVVVDPTGEKAVIVPELFDDVGLTIQDEAIRRSKYIYIMAKHLVQYPTIAKTAQQFETKIMVDIEPSSHLSAEPILKVLETCQIASFNEQGFISAFNKPFSIEKAKKLLDLGPEIIIVTRGKKGAVAIKQDDVVEVPGYAIDVKDTTGAGDTFSAAFMYGTIQGLKLHDRVQLGNAAAAILIQTIGTRTNLPNLENIRDFINNN